MQVKRLINASVEEVWEILIDTQLWPVWGPSVSAVECSQRRITADSCGRLKTAIGLWVEFEISCFEPLSFWDWKVAGLPATGHRLESKGAAISALMFELPFVALPYALICRQALNRVAQLAEGAKDD